MGEPKNNIRIESQMAQMQSEPKQVEQLGKVWTETCPECGGSLWEIADEDLLRFRCHVGHAYTAEDLLSEQEDALERALASALRVSEEIVMTTDRMSAQGNNGQENRQEKKPCVSPERLEDCAKRAKETAAAIRRLLLEEAPML